MYIEAEYTDACKFYVNIKKATLKLIYKLRKFCVMKVFMS